MKIRKYRRTLAMATITLVTGLTAWGMHVMLPADPLLAWGMAVNTGLAALCTVNLFLQQRKAARITK